MKRKFKELKIYKSAISFSKSAYQFLLNSWISFTKDNGSILASSMVHSTLISLVPFFALLYALLSSFGTFKTKLTHDISGIIADFSSNILIPVEADDIIAAVVRFVENTKSLGFVGLLTFTITSFFLINRIWSIFNQLYKTKPKKNTFSQFLSYLFFLIIGSFLLGISLTLTSIVRKWILNYFAVGVFEQILLSGFQLLIFLILLFSMIKFIPSTYVKTSSALLASVIGTIAWHIVSNLYIFLFTGIINFGPIYNSLASIIVFIFWVYTAWIIIFLSVKISYVHQYKPYISMREKNATNAINRMTDCLDVIILIAENFATGKGDTCLKDISSQLKTNDIEVIKCLDVFVENKIILEVGTNKKSYSLACPLEKVSLKNLFTIISGKNGNDKAKSIGSVTMDNILEIVEKNIEDITLKDLLEKSLK